MKVTISSFFISLLLFVACDNPTSVNGDNKIEFHSIGSYFSTTESIDVVIENRTDSNFVIAIRGGLVMYYQKMENDKWSKRKLFPWMSCKCPSVFDTLKSNDIFKYTINPNILGSSGTYRLMLSDTTIVSNIFEIE